VSGPPLYSLEDLALPSPGRLSPFFDVGYTLELKSIQVVTRRKATASPAASLACRGTQHGLVMSPILSRIVENLVSFAMWYVLWQVADFIFKVQH
jgi:hypothetical protein